MWFSNYISIILVQSLLQIFAQELADNEIYFQLDYVNVEKYIIQLTNCTNLYPEIAGKTWVVYTNQHKCVQLYDQQNCMGGSIRLTPRSIHQDTLFYWEFGEKTESVGICTESCTPNAGETVQDNGTNPISITFYEDVKFGGTAHLTQVVGCTRVPEKKIKSLRIPKGVCILAFMSNSTNEQNQAGHEHHPSCLVKDNYNVLELYDGVPYLDNLTEWYLYPTEYVEAVAPCQCNYLRFPDPPTLDGSYVILFSDLNFQGRSQVIPLNFTGCKDFVTDTDYNLIDWMGAVQSIAVGNGSCVQLYEEQDCADLSHFKLTESVPNLYEYNLRWAVRSVGICESGNLDNSDEYSTPSTNEGTVNIGSISTYLIPIVSIGVIISVILIAATVYTRKRNLRLQSAIREILTEKEITEFLEGFQSDSSTTEDGFGESQICKDIEESETPIQTFGFEVLAQNQPYNYELEVSHSQLEYDSKHCIGEGEYGLVFKGTLSRGEETLSVAIKTTKHFSASKGLRSLLKEVKIMMYVGQHSKIVTLIGCCTENLREGELLIVMEYCEHGSLEKYLKENKSKFINLCSHSNGNHNDPKSVKNTEYVSNFETSKNNVDVIASTSSSVSMNSEANSFARQLISWSIEIAEGMEYLADKKVIHGDLSARNILLMANKSAKISDFGLARKLYAYQQYIRTGDEALPWRWLALESLKKMEFSTASDVWSYGILLWEIFSLGDQPYPGILYWTSNFIKKLEQGVRPTIPHNATSQCYKIMYSCWEKDPKRRPTFSSLQSRLRQIETNVTNDNIAEYEVIHYV